MKKIKIMLGFMAFASNCIVMDYVDAGVLGFKWAIYLLLADLVLLAIFNANKRKKSAASRPRNGQAHHRHMTFNYNKCTTTKGGMSSVL